MAVMIGIIGKCLRTYVICVEKLAFSKIFFFFVLSMKQKQYRVCVGILVPPKEDQDWFCRVCISRKQEDKKKKRKKKDKKDH